jgi:hypothetical protein
VHGEPADVVTPDLDLAGVETDADIESELSRRGADRGRASNGARRSSKVARKPSPVVFTSRPRNASS